MLATGEGERSCDEKCAQDYQGDALFDGEGPAKLHDSRYRDGDEHGEDVRFRRLGCGHVSTGWGEQAKGRHACDETAARRREHGAVDVQGRGFLGGGSALVFGLLRETIRDCEEYRSGQRERDERYLNRAAGKILDANRCERGGKRRRNDESPFSATGKYSREPPDGDGRKTDGEQSDSRKLHGGGERRGKLRGGKGQHGADRARATGDKREGRVICPCEDAGEATRHDQCEGSKNRHKGIRHGVRLAPVEGGRRGSEEQVLEIGRAQHGPIQRKAYGHSGSFAHVIPPIPQSRLMIVAHGRRGKCARWCPARTSAWERVECCFLPRNRNLGEW